MLFLQLAAQQGTHFCEGKSVLLHLLERHDYEHTSVGQKKNKKHGTQGNQIHDLKSFDLPLCHNCHL